MKTQLALIFAATLSVPALAADPVAKGDPKAATAIVTQVCAACHSMDGNSATPANPSLAGQGYDYLNKQLTDFKSGERKSAVMGGMVANLSPADMKNLAAYFSEKQAKERTAKDMGKALLGQKIYRGGVQGSGVAGLRLLPWRQRPGHPGAIPAPCRTACRLHAAAVEQFPCRRPRQRCRQDDARDRCEDDPAGNGSSRPIHRGLAVELAAFKPVKKG